MAFYQLIKTLSIYGVKYHIIETENNFGIRLDNLIIMDRFWTLCNSEQQQILLHMIGEKYLAPTEDELPQH